AGGLAHVMTRGVRRKWIYMDDEDRLVFLSRLLRVQVRHGWRCLAYCLMSNHYHLLLETPGANLSAGMQWLNSVYAAHFSARYGQAGHVFERRFRSVPVETERQLAEEFRYIVLNPVRAKMCERADQWPWSSYCESIGLVPSRAADRRRLLRYFGASAGPAEAQAALAAFVQTAMPGV